tara:strand:+ start:666 stop:881 length:216 start_codon:yes stop_codon:yes gene_type:complete
MGKIQYQIEYMIESDVLETEIEFTEKKAIDRAKKVMSLNTEKGAYASISKLEEDDWGYYNTIEQDYITINK